MNRKNSNRKSIQEYVNRLFKKNPRHISQTDMFRLREQFRDEDILDQIQDAFIEQGKDIRSRARKFARLVKEKYHHRNFPLHILLKKALKYKQKYNINDTQFEEFKRIYENEILGTNNAKLSHEVSHPFTTIGRTLGQGYVDLNDGIVTKGDKDMRILQEIVKMYDQSKPLHAQIVLRSMSYSDCAIEALTGTYNPEKHNAQCFIHPVIAALFIPKFAVIENQVLLANLSYVVKQRYTKQPILTSNDHELFQSLINDPTDIVCSSESAVRDLYLRSQLQATIWNQVISLRSGRYYDCNNTNLVIALNNCKRNLNENPEITHINDEALYLQKILAAFSLRPTICATTPLMSTLVANDENARPLVPSVSTISMLTLRLNRANGSNSLNDCLDKQQWYVEDGNLVPKNQKVIYSRGLLVFYVPRRAHTLNIAAIKRPFDYTFNKLPATVAGFEKINPVAVEVPNTVLLQTSGSTSYHLRSVICLKTLVDNNTNISHVIGQTAIIINNGQKLLYDPVGVISTQTNSNSQSSNDKFIRNTPVLDITVNQLQDNKTQWSPYDADELISKTGTVYIYQDSQDHKRNTHRYASDLIPFGY